MQIEHCDNVFICAEMPQLLAMSASLRLMSLLTAATAPSLSPHLLWSSSSFSGAGGRNQKGMAEMNIRLEDRRKPSHQAPTQRASFGVMVTLSEQHKIFCLNAQEDVWFDFYWCILLTFRTHDGAKLNGFLHLTNDLA